MDKQDQPIDGREAEVVEDMILDAMEYIHGKGTEEIVKALKTSTDMTTSLSAIAYKVVRGVAEKNKATSRVAFDMDMMMGVATEAIDMLMEVAEASNQVLPGANMDRIREDTLLKMTMLHGEQLGEPSDEQKGSAQADLRDYMSDGGTQKAFDYINTRAKEEGLNPNDMMRAGNELAFGTKHPLAAAVQERTGRVKPSPLMPAQVPPALTEAPQAAPLPPGHEGRPPLMPDPLPTGPGIGQGESRFPPPQDPNAALSPIPERRY